MGFVSLPDEMTMTVLVSSFTQRTDDHRSGDEHRKRGQAEGKVGRGYRTIARDIPVPTKNNAFVEILLPQC